MIPALAPTLLQRHGDPKLVGEELIWRIEDAIANAPRTVQKLIGPSEIGDPCGRRIAYRLLGTPERTQPAKWRATVGTGVHLWLADVFGGSSLDTVPMLDVGQERFAVETRVSVGEVDGIEITGTCDLYDRVTATVVDWKTTSRAKLAAYRSNGTPGEQYRAQAHLYGRGWRRGGLPVDTVMVIILPRDGELRDAWIWHESYDDALALGALERLQSIARLTGAFGVDALDMLPTVDAFCLRCPYWQPNSTRLAHGCPGDPSITATATTPRASALQIGN